MSHIYTSAEPLIGRTPLLELTHLEKKYGLKARILAKLEYLNPAGSVKDRIARAMIDDAEARGLLHEGSVIMIPANVKHWHGAAKDEWFSHLAIEVPGEETKTEWLEAVDDGQYLRTQNQGKAE